MVTDNVPQEQQGDNESISDCPGIILEDITVSNEQNAPRQKVPKRVLHFSDGDMVEYSSEEDEADAPKAEAQVAEVNPKSLPWMPWAWYQTVWVGSKVLNGCDYVGEALADFLGITSPKYQLEIEEYKRIQAKQREEIAKQDLEMGGWNERHQNNLIENSSVITNE